MQIQDFTRIRQCISRDAIVGHETAWKVSDLGLVQYKHNYDMDLLERIRQAAIKLKEERAFQKHLDLTFITGADRFIPEIGELLHDPKRLDFISELAGTRLEPYPMSVVGSTVTFMGPYGGDGTVDWHCDGVPVTELIPLSISDPIIGGELEVFLDNCEIGKAKVERGEEIPESDLLRIPHKVGCSTLAQFVGIFHRTAPIKYGERITLVLNSRSVDRPFVDDNRMFYLAADNDQDRNWVEEMAEDVWSKQLPAYRRYEALTNEVRASSKPGLEVPTNLTFDPALRSTW